MNHEKSKSEDTHGLHKICCSGTEVEAQASLELVANQSSTNHSRFLGVCILIAGMIIGGTIIFVSRSKITDVLSVRDMAKLEAIVLPKEGVTLPIKWGSLGKQLVDNGTIDSKKFGALYSQRGGLDEEIKSLLTKTDNGQLIITKENSGAILNLLWALGLANKNVILEKGPMADKQYGGAGNFASTGGWTLAVGNSMDHYSRHTMIPLTPEQQLLVENVSKNIYRPCCGNSTYFPDCNHGMAMLGLLELMASQGVSEADMYKAALAVNSYWFPDTYLNIAQYLKSKGLSWNKVGEKEILSANFSSATGYQQILKQVQPAPSSGGSGCGI